MALVRAQTPQSSTDGAPVPGNAADIERLTRDFQALSVQQAAIAEKIERLRGRPRRTSTKAIEEAEEIARAADSGDGRRDPEG